MGKINENRSKNSKIKFNTKDLLLRANRKRPSLAASVTIEASLVLPLFLFFFVNLLGVFDILKFQCDLEAALHQTGRQLMITEATTRSFAKSEDGDSALGAATGALNAAVAGKMVKNYLGEEYLDHSPINGGASGLKLGETTFYSNGDIIDIVATYKAHPLFKIAAFTDFSVEGRFYGHAFTGYSPGESHEKNDETDELVYITDHGTVYHKSLDCSHLKLSVKQISKSEVSGKRNADRAKYYPCEYCGKKAGSSVYITNFGSRYHSNRNCSGIKRTIRTVRLSEAIGKSPCKECAG
ncbi:hypothetical protein SAMN04487770_11483 [Butyrivibrio sp. ob235]|uniref:hypothetical protein n=1 Tax=Butyrivibrio sp. ob235 TaxID=1761780 RepID=UPI0008D38CEF|nr:hypothetical protein [Butyrivibrio sp. ob235]SEL66333.1 hypothetical protein SAMN04487770_11483 [Butyrivibrio sp. ob235]